ncbi:MAG TPA: heme-binding protein [Halothiobacillus sp.]|nr:heme-binding protein [Halothiobacillus sp.]HQT44095.1 heme-binding protein [Halothiobacillus sp.]
MKTFTCSLRLVKLPMTLLALGFTGWGGLLSAQAADSEPTWTQKVITPAFALKAAEAAKMACGKRGWPITVAVTDPSGLPLVVLRDRLAGWHTYEVAIGKARTSASWRTATSTVAANVTKPDSAEKSIMNQPGVVMIGGGLPIEAAGSLVGAIGVSGAPGGANDDICAQAGIAAIQGDLDL